MRLRQRRDGSGSFVVVPDLKGDRKGFLEASDGDVGVPEEKIEPTEVVRQPANVDAVADLFVLRLRPLRVRPRENPVSIPFRDERGLEIGLSDGSRVLKPLGKLK